MFGWHVGAAVREDRSPTPGRSRRSRFWHPRVKGACSRAGTRRVPVPAGQGSAEHRMTGQQVKWRVHGSGAAEEEERAAAWCRLCCSEKWQQTAWHRDVTQVPGGAGREMLRLPTAAPGKGRCELPAGQQLQRVWGKAVPRQRRLQRGNAGVRQSIPAQEVAAAGCQGGRTYGPKGPVSPAAPQAGPARCPALAWQRAAAQAAPGPGCPG